MCYGRQKREHDPFGLHLMLSPHSFKISKHHVKRFQSFMHVWTQINKDNDHLVGLETNKTR
ncbi:hypothetical protein K440DRAFT_630390 [Wilcoxina mikolae CBS 423.85]|nr:hypothetical protein K440DRAFT_630390 [Wilcoxina mikolae CBS 423.85]